MKTGTLKIKDARGTNARANSDERLFYCGVFRAGFVVFGLMVSALVAQADTNNVTTALQKGLFQEEGNHDLAAAIQEYQAVLADFAKLRQIAATATFRLGECYRKQGNTNAANTQYQRVLREFPDQTELAALSRNYLAAAGQAAPSDPSTSAEAEQVRRIRAMIKDSPDLINARDASNGDTPLHTAAQQGQMVVAQFLLANGADVNARNTSFGRTPLHQAAEHGNNAMLELLLDHKADVDAADSNGFTPLHRAAQRGFRTAVETLLAHGANVNARAGDKATPLHLASENGFAAVCGVLLMHGADPSALGEVSTQGPLHIAARRNDAGLAELLLTNRAEVNSKDGAGMTPLLDAAESGSMAAAKVLLKHGADANARAENTTHPGWTPLFFATMANQRIMVELLLQNKAEADLGCEVPGNPGWPFGVGVTPLILAAYRGDAEIVEFLISAGADTNFKTTNGFCPILGGATTSERTNSLGIVRMLVAHGADINAKDNGNRTALMWAADRRRQELVSELLKHGADLNAHDIEGKTALHHLVLSMRQGFTQSSAGPPEEAADIAETLLKAGAEVNGQDNDARTPLTLAQQRSSLPGMAKLIEALKKHGALPELPDFKSIRVTRAGLDNSIVVLRADTNGLNHFTRLEAIAYCYASGVGLPVMGPPGSVGSLLFPDFSRVKILRPVAEHPGERKELPLHLLTGADTFDCENDADLEFGDIVDLPEREHPLSELPVALTAQQKAALVKCLSRKVTLVVKGQPLVAALDGTTPNAYLSKALGLPTFQGFLKSSSDLSRVTVKRAMTKDGQPQEIHEDVLPFWSGKQPLSNDLWLRDGDVIEVPDK